MVIFEFWDCWFEVRYNMGWQGNRQIFFIRVPDLITQVSCGSTGFLIIFVFTNLMEKYFEHIFGTQNDGLLKCRDLRQNVILAIFRMNQRKYVVVMRFALNSLRFSQVFFQDKISPSCRSKVRDYDFDVKFEHAESKSQWNGNMDANYRLWRRYDVLFLWCFVDMLTKTHLFKSY